MDVLSFRTISYRVDGLWQYTNMRKATAAGILNKAGKTRSWLRQVYPLRISYRDCPGTMIELQDGMDFESVERGKRV